MGEHPTAAEGTTSAAPSQNLPNKDPWANHTVRFRTRSEMLAARNQRRETNLIAGAAPVFEPPAFKVDRNSKEYEPLPKEQALKGSRAHLLETRANDLAKAAQALYDKKEARETMWVVPSYGLPADHVANPKHATLTEINDENKRGARQTAGLTAEPNLRDSGRPLPFSVDYVENPKASSKSALLEQRGQSKTKELQATVQACKGHRGPLERLTKREDQWTISRINQPVGRSRRQMQEDRKTRRMNYEDDVKRMHSADKKAAPTWDSRGPSDPFWRHNSAFVAAPAEQSAARQLASKRAHIKPAERFNRYSDPQPDPFKVEREIKLDDEGEPILNVTAIAPFERKELLHNLKNIRTKETNFTDYQLYFRNGIREQAAAVDDPLDSAPVFSQFSPNKEFDNNVWLPAHLKRFRQPFQLDSDVGEDEGESEASPRDLPDFENFADAQGSLGSADVENVESRKSRPLTATAGVEAGGDRTVLPAPAQRGKQRPFTSKPSKRPNPGTKSYGTRPLTAFAGSTREIKRRPNPSTLVQRLRGSDTAGVRTGAWQLISSKQNDRPL